MTFIRKQNSYILIFAMILNISCMREIPVHHLNYYSINNESPGIQKEEKTHNEQDCDLIWYIQYENRKEIFFRNTCTNRSCIVTWKSMNILGRWSILHYDHIPPQGEMSYPVSLSDVHFEVDYHFNIINGK